MTERPSFYQAKGMEEFSGVQLTDLQVGLYIAMRESEKWNKVTDQKLMAMVLEVGDGDIETFKKAYPQIFNK